MGALFAILGGFYFWIGKIIGKSYNESLAQIQFWSLFFGVNITFFPMHFLGIAGMPRRYPDYPDAYASWNAICSYGSLLSLVSTFLFLYIIFDMLYNGESIKLHNYWNNTQYFDIEDNNASTSLEWVINTPPSSHNFSSVVKSYNS